MTAGLERSMLSFVQERVAALERRLERYDPDTASEAFTDGAPSLAIHLRARARFRRLPLGSSGLANFRYLVLVVSVSKRLGYARPFSVLNRLIWLATPAVRRSDVFTESDRRPHGVAS